jgi:hypothetical protein
MDAVYSHRLRVDCTVHFVTEVDMRRRWLGEIVPLHTVSAALDEQILRTADVKNGQTGAVSVRIF